MDNDGKENPEAQIPPLLPSHPATCAFTRTVAASKTQMVSLARSHEPKQSRFLLLSVFLAIRVVKTARLLPGSPPRKDRLERLQRTRIFASEAASLFTPLASASRPYLYVTLNLFQGLVFFLYVTLNSFQGLFFEMLNQVQHDGVGGC